MMLEKGVAATAGHVGEPYVQAFPVPEIFFGFLAEGILSLVECYIISTPYLSWKMVRRHRGTSLNTQITQSSR